MDTNILYTVIIYRDINKLEIYDSTQKLIENNYYKTDIEIYQKIIKKTHDCHDIEKIEIIYK